MTTSIIGLFENGDIASKVLGELTKAGFKKDAVEILQDVAASKISSRLVEAGYEKDKAESYGKAMQKGGALIVAEVEDDKADEALSTMRSFKALTPEALLEKLGNRTSEEAQTAQVIEEELEVGVSRTTGGKRLKTEVSEREVQETVTLHEENVEVEHTKVDRVLKPEEAAKAFQENHGRDDRDHGKAGRFQAGSRGRGSLAEQAVGRARRHRQRHRPPSGCHRRGNRPQVGQFQEVLRAETRKQAPSRSSRTVGEPLSALHLKPCRSREISNRGIVYVRDHE